jgi:hypothetical protein
MYGDSERMNVERSSDDVPTEFVSFATKFWLSGHQGPEFAVFIISDSDLIVNHIQEHIATEYALRLKDSIDVS